MEENMNNYVEEPVKVEITNFADFYTAEPEVEPMTFRALLRASFKAGLASAGMLAGIFAPFAVIGAGKWAWDKTMSKKKAKDEIASLENSINNMNKIIDFIRSFEEITTEHEEIAKSLCLNIMRSKQRIFELKAKYKIK